jgi:endonuclease IV
MRKIGFSTGCLYKLGFPCNEMLKAYSSFSVDAVELSFSRADTLTKFNPSKYFINQVKAYNYISIHASWREIRYGKNEETKNVISKLTELCDNLNIAGIVIHPDSVDDFSILEKSSLPFLMENMDIRKKFGFKPEEFETLKKDYSFGFVLDTEHAYEHDSSMKLAEELINTMGDRLRHLHVSGQDFKSKYHSLVYKADNKSEISKILRKSSDVPWILEGVLSQNFEEEIKKELEFLRKI